MPLTAEPPGRQAGRQPGRQPGRATRVRLTDPVTVAADQLDLWPLVEYAGLTDPGLDVGALLRAFPQGAPTRWVPGNRDDFLFLHTADPVGHPMTGLVHVTVGGGGNNGGVPVVRTAGLTGSRPVRVGAVPSPKVTGGRWALIQFSYPTADEVPGWPPRARHTRWLHWEPGDRPLLFGVYEWLGRRTIDAKQNYARSRIAGELARHVLLIPDGATRSSPPRPGGTALDAPAWLRQTLLDIHAPATAASLDHGLNAEYRRLAEEGLARLHPTLDDLARPTDSPAPPDQASHPGAAGRPVLPAPE